MTLGSLSENRELSRLLRHGRRVCARPSRANLLVTQQLSSWTCVDLGCYPASMLSQLRNLMVEAGVSFLWVSRPENIRYLTSFTAPDDARVLVTPDDAVLYTDSRYTLQATQEYPGPIEILRGPDVQRHAVARVGLESMGFEAEHCTFQEALGLSEAFGRTITPTRELIERVRLVKTEAEVAKIRRAAEITDAALAATLPLVRPGVTELDLALELEFHARRHGANGVAFELIVASGPRGAMPHGAASTRALQDNELVTFDIGFTFDGYNSDMTRTVAVGEPGESLRAVYRVVREAQSAGVRAVKPGVSAGSVDEAARAVITRAGYGASFTHSTGHGVGLAIHEGPAVSSTGSVILQPGMVITVEPGIYLPDQGGVRIEDLVLVTDTGADVLSRARKADL